MTLEESFAHALNGNVLLFIGAGYSKGATNKRGANLKLGDEFALHLSRLAGAPSDFPLQDAAEAYRGKFGANALLSEIDQEFSVTSVSETHKIVATIPWMRIYTTNYDNTFAVAAREIGQKVLSITTEADPFTLPKQGMTCIHLNGSVAHLSVEALDSSLRLTESSYVSSSVADSPWGIKFREDARLASAVFFVGYSLKDLDVSRLLVASHPKQKEKCFFITGDSPSEILKLRLQRYGSIVAESAEVFVEKLKDFSVGYRPPVNVELALNSLVEFFPQPTLNAPSDQAILDLFELGLVDLGMLERGFQQKSRYCLERTKQAQLFDLIEKGLKVVAVTSALGNGKTLFLKTLAVRAKELGYRVFSAEEVSEQSAIEFERIACLSGKVIVLVDNYPKWLDGIRAFSQVCNNDKRLVLSARSSAHDILFERLEEICGVTSVPEIHLDKLDAAEIEWFVDTLNEFGLWRTAAGKQRSERIRIIAENYHGEIHGVLLGLLNSSDIGGRVKKLIEDTKKDPRYFEVVSSVFVVAALGLNCSIDILSDLWGVELISSANFRSHASIKQLLDFTAWRVKVKSPVVSEYALKATIGADILPVLIKLCEHASKAARASSAFHSELLRELQKYSSIQRLLPEEGRRAACIRYYEAIKPLPQLQGHPLFWLQYAIACFVEGDLKRARIYFETAYSLSGRTNFNTYQIDNHYARFLLMEAADSDLSVEKAIDNFRKARAIINQQMQHERRDNPYRAAICYQDFIDKFGRGFNESMCKEVGAAAEHVLGRIADLPQQLRESRPIRRCLEAMQYVLKQSQQLLVHRQRLYATPGQALKNPKQPPPLPPK